MGDIRATWNTRYLLLLAYGILHTLQIALAEEADILDALGSERAVSIATGYKRAVREAPAVATVITADDIRAMGATTLEQVIESVAGFHVSTPDAASTVLTVRGITSRVLVLRNGVPLGQGLFVNAFRDLSNSQINNLERIEVIRGPGSAVYGADAFAGIINLVTKTAQDIHGTEVGGRAGSFDTYEGWLLQGGQWGGFDVALSISGRTTNGFDKTIEADAQTNFDRLFGTHASLAPSSINTQRDFVDVLLDVSRGPWTLRGGYTGQLNVGTGVGISNSLDPIGKGNFDLIDTDLTYHTNFLNSLDITANVSYVGVNTDARVLLFPPGAFRGAFPAGVRQNLGIEERRIRSEFTALYTGSNHHRIRLGLGEVVETSDNVEDRRNYTIRRGVPVPTGSFAEGGGIGDVQLFPDADRDIFFTYAQDEWSFAPDWTLTSGLRLDRYSDVGDAVDPRVGLVWNTNYNLTTKLLYGRAFRPPSFVEQHSNGFFQGLGNSNLHPVTIDTVELAFDYRTAPFRSNLSLFWYTINDIIKLAPQRSSPNGLEFINGKEQNGYGLEWEFAFNITPSLGLKWNYAYQNRYVTDDTINIRFAPTHQVYAEANWRFAPEWNFNANVKSIIDRERPAGDPRPPVKDYSIVNVSLQHRNVATKHLDMSLSVRNLLDADARDPSDSPTALPFDIPLSGRSLMGEVRFQW